MRRRSVLDFESELDLELELELDGVGLGASWAVRCDFQWHCFAFCQDQDPSIQTGAYLNKHSK